MAELEELIPDRLRARLGNLCPAEKRILAEVDSGEWIDFRVIDSVTGKPKEGPENAPKQYATWGQERTVRADFLAWFVTSDEVARLAPAKGIQIRGIRVEGRLDLEEATLPRQLQTEESAFPGGITLLHARSRSITLEACYLTANDDSEPFLADGLHVCGALLADKIIVDGTFRLLGAKIDSQFSCDQAQFSRDESGADAFVADELHIDGGFFARGVIANGEFRLVGAKIGGQLSCNEATFTMNESFGLAFVADRLKVGGSFHAVRTIVNGEFRLLGAKINGILSCDGARFTKSKSSGYAFYSDCLQVDGDLFARKVIVDGEFRLSGARIGGVLSCDEGVFAALESTGYALDAGRLQVCGDFLARDVKVDGGIWLSGASIDGRLWCDESLFTKSEKTKFAFNGDRLQIGGDVFANKIIVNGEFGLLGAKINGQLSCNEAQFTKDKSTGFAINADGLELGGALLAKGAVVDGLFALPFARIHGYAMLRFEKKTDTPNTRLLLRQAVFDALLEVSCAEGCQLAEVDLTGTKVKELNLDRTSWPPISELELQGIRIDTLGKLDKYFTPMPLSDYPKWLELQPQRPFTPQPWQEIARVLRQMGHEKEAKEILIAKERRRLKYAEIGIFAKAWSWFLDKTIGYGHKPGRVLTSMFALMLLGSATFGIASKYGLISEVERGKVHAAFNCIWYAIDRFLPIIDLGQNSAWLPDPSITWLSAFQYVYIILGWVLTTLLIAAMTGLIRRE